MENISMTFLGGMILYDILFYVAIAGCVGCLS